MRKFIAILALLALVGATPVALSGCGVIKQITSGNQTAETQQNIRISIGSAKLALGETVRVVAELARPEAKGGFGVLDLGTAITLLSRLEQARTALDKASEYVIVGDLEMAKASLEDAQNKILSVNNATSGLGVSI